MQPVGTLTFRPRGGEGPMAIADPQLMFRHEAAASAAARPDSPLSFIRRLVSTHCVVVFGKSDCPYTISAKRILDSLKADYEAVDVDRLSNGEELRRTLRRMTRVKTVPRVFVGGRCIGGGDETKRLYKNGRLKRLIDECQCEKASGSDSDEDHRAWHNAARSHNIAFVRRD